MKHNAIFNLKQYKNKMVEAKLVDKDPTAKKTYLQCMLCQNFATNPTGDSADKESYQWKSKADMDLDELENAELGEKGFSDLNGQIGISTGICPTCLPAYLEEIKNYTYTPTAQQNKGSNELV